MSDREADNPKLQFLLERERKKNYILEQERIQQEKNVHTLLFGDESKPLIDISGESRSANDDLENNTEKISRLYRSAQIRKSKLYQKISKVEKKSETLTFNNKSSITPILQIVED